jgi:CubicO group peptidase (beta-lactamase class C family)
VKQVATSAGLPGACGMGWWTNAADRYDYLPKDAVWGAGAGDQLLLVVPSLNLIMVRNGATLVPPPKQKDKKTDDEFKLYHDPRAKVLFEPLIGAVTDRPKKSGAYFPPPESQGGWRALTSPDDIRTRAGMDPARLAQLKEWLLASDRRNFAALIIRNGYVVLDVERNLSSRTATGNAKSCAKAVCATVLGIASEESKTGKLPRRMSFDDPAFDFIPWAKPLSDPRKARIAVKQLLNHTSGIAPESTGARNQGPWEYVLGLSGDAKTAKLAFDPGTDLGYTTHGLYHAALVCETVTGMPYDEYAITRLLKPIGAEKWWFEQFDGGPKIGKHPSHALGMPARDLARIPYCLLRGGKWNDRQVVPEWFIEETAGPTHSVKGKKSFDREAESFSHGWELPGLLGGDRGRGIPKDARFKPGSGGQLIAFVPSLDLVVVRHTGSSGSWQYEEYLRRACACVANPTPGPSSERGGEENVTPPSLPGKGGGGLGSPYPPSSIITGIEWAPKESIVRRAKGSDNWPLTWADDDHLYTAYGDGNGFEPFIKPKLSMGFARVEGGPTDFQGINISTPTGETLGDGAKGKKASGILMVDGVLYLWTRNAGNSQLAWSKDRGQTWEWADWKFTTSFGCPTFLNFGKNYAGARDDFVYIYSHDNDSAYLPADRMVMARVPKNAIRDRNAYEFFAGLDAKGQPRWSKDIADRGAVFTHTGRCYRSGITYNPALKRYLWVQIVPGSQGKKPDTRFEGGFGIFDAPEPWGPWTTAFFTEKWDVGPGESASLPAKWMSPDGRTVHLVFSGDDTFAVRKATLRLAGK